MRVALLSPYDGGSHRSWSTGLQRHCVAEIQRFGLPARFWKWRMHGAALTLARGFPERPDFDLIVATDMLDLGTFLALTRDRTASIPTILYAHENQLTYPLPDDPAIGPMRRQAGERDRHYGFINLASMLVADRVLFNSAYHRNAFLRALPSFLRHFPDYRELESVDLIAARAEVLPVGIEVEPLIPAEGQDGPPLILWNQRWEYDKNPEGFFAALQRLAGTDCRFGVALCGERFARQPRAFERGLEALGDRVEHAGWLPRDDYAAMLGRADVVVSTAHHEFFGISVIEAICAGAWPVLPRRLAYPEVLPAGFHDQCLYEGDDELDRLLRDALARRRDDPERLALTAAMRDRYDWREVAPRYDEAFAAIAAPQ